MKYIRTDKAPAPLGPYEQAIAHNGTVYVAMQLPVTPDGKAATESDIETQAQIVLENLKGILEAAGSGLDRALRVCVYLTDISLGKRVNAVYERFFQDHKPPRSVIGVSALPLGCTIAIDILAAIDDD